MLGLSRSRTHLSNIKIARILNEKDKHPQRVAVWYAIMCDRIIGVYVFENAEDFTETVNGERSKGKSLHQ